MSTFLQMNDSARWMVDGGWWMVDGAKKIFLHEREKCSLHDSFIFMGGYPVSCPTCP